MNVKKSMLKKLAEYLEENPVYQSTTISGKYTNSVEIPKEEKEKIKEELIKFSNYNLERIETDKKIEIDKYKLLPLGGDYIMISPYGSSNLTGKIYLLGEEGYAKVYDKGITLRPKGKTYIGKIKAIVQKNDDSLVIYKEKKETKRRIDLNEISL